MSAVVLAKDVLGYDCVPFEMLDLAFQEFLSKGHRLPQTCLPMHPDRSIGQLAEVIGREPFTEEWVAFEYRWFSVFDPDRVLFTPMELLPETPEMPAVPIPSSMAMLITAIFILVKIRRRLL